MNFLELWFTPLSILIAALSLVWGFYIYKKQSNILIFIEYTKRYESIMESFPSNARSYRFDYGEDLPKESEELTLAILKYLNLSSEEYYLWDSGQLSDKVWSIWESELIRTIESKLVRREWEKIKTEFDSYFEFKKNVELLMQPQKITPKNKRFIKGRKILKQIK